MVCLLNMASKTSFSSGDGPFLTNGLARVPMIFSGPGPIFPRTGWLNKRESSETENVLRATVCNRLVLSCCSSSGHCTAKQKLGSWTLHSSHTRQVKTTWPLIGSLARSQGRTSGRTSSTTIIQSSLDSKYVNSSSSTSSWLKWRSLRKARPNTANSCWQASTLSPCKKENNHDSCSASSLLTHFLAREDLPIPEGPCRATQTEL
mmetsp:Transcript_11667/g.22199  ORF Transcript_11667/g.22199 Transcript_11667/m.22199 type:complete len:205 (-) Transcript_11667:1108-1722(-)